MAQTKHMYTPRSKVAREGGKRRLALEVIASAMNDLAKRPRNTEGACQQSSAKLFLLDKTRVEDRRLWLYVAGVREEAVQDRAREIMRRVR